MINGFHIPGDPRLCTHLGTGVSLKALLLQSSELLESLSPRLPNRPGNTVPSLCSAGVPAEGFSSSHPTQFPHKGDAERSHQWEELLPYEGWTGAVAPAKIPKGNMSAGKKLGTPPSLLFCSGNNSRVHERCSEHACISGSL